MIKINMINFNNWLGGVDIYNMLLKIELEKYYKCKVFFNDNDLNKYDIIHNHNPYNPIKSDILTFHSLDLRDDLLDNVYNAVDNASIKTCITEYQKNHLHKQYGIKIDYVIPNFSDMVYFPKELLPKRPFKTIGYIGRLDKDKGINDILELAKEYTNLNFVLIGYNQDNYNFKKYPNIKHIDHIYNRRVLAGLIDSIDLFVHPSNLDTMPISILDVIFRKKPIIIKDIESLNCLYFGAMYYNDLEDLKRKIDLIINNYDYDRLEKAFNYAYFNFHPYKITNKYYDLYNLIVRVGV